MTTPRCGSPLLEAWQWGCYWCKRPRKFRDVQIDHILPQTVTATRLERLARVHDLGADFDLHRPANLAPICDSRPGVAAVPKSCQN